MFRKAFIEKRGDGSLRHEEALVAPVLRARGIDVELFTQKLIDRRALPLSDDTFVMGAMDAMHGAMKQLEIPIPLPDDYPAALTPWMRRRVWRATLRDVEAAVWSETSSSVFAKPADRRKSFTGRVFRHHDDLYYLGSASRRQAVLCSEVVRWLSEYRVYVIQERIVAVSHYAGERDTMIDHVQVQLAVDAYRASGQAPCAYAIDFGVLAGGCTALIEANDGYSLGAYDIDTEAYTDLLLLRWRELLTMRASSDEAQA
jgi:hypothetical protein